MTSAADFALTKIQAPRARSGLVARDTLVDRLAAGLATSRLTLLCAPAGFGKTSLLTLALARADAPRCAWLSLEDDDDLQRLLACLFAALEPFDPPWRVAPEALVAAAAGGKAERRGVVDALVNALAATGCERAVIVLDDLHRVEDPAVGEFLDAFAERLPPSWGLVVVTRVEPPLALARWRAQDEITDLREPDLRFSQEETAALAALLADPVPPAQLARIVERTGGWVAGLRLALRPAASAPPALAWGRPGALRDRHAFDYLASEVLGELPAALAAFLLRCSVLPELTAARCQLVSGDVNAVRHLAEIERRGLFASLLDGPEPTLRLHDLFRDFLEDRLLRDLPDELPGLLQRAARSEPDDSRRIAWLMRAGDWAGAESLMVAALPRWLSAGLTAQAQRVLEQFPPSWRERSAQLALLQGLAAWSRWEFVAMDQHFAQAVQLALQSGQPVMAQRGQAYLAMTSCQMDRADESAALIDALRTQSLPPDIEITVLTAAMWHAGDYGPVAEVAQHAARRNTLLAHTADPSTWYQSTPNPRDVMLPGMREPLEQFLDRASQVLPDATTPPRAIVLLLQGLVALWCGDAATADERFGQADAAARWLDRPRNVMTMLAMARGQWQALCGDIGGCRATIAHLLADPDQEVPSPRLHKLRRHMQFNALRLALTVGDMATAQALLPVGDAAEEGASRRSAQRGRVLAMPAYRAEIEGRQSDAAAAWGVALAEPDAIDVQGLWVEATLRAAALQFSLGRDDAALELVAAAVGRCESDGFVGSALLAGPVVLQQLAGSAALHAQPRLHGVVVSWLATARRLRGAAAGLQPAPGAPAEAAAQGSAGVAGAAAAASGLSDREREVLDHIAAGDSNKLIARALDLSPHTVKRHVANILDKLGLESRVHAAAWWNARR